QAEWHVAKPGQVRGSTKAFHRPRLDRVTAADESHRSTDGDVLRMLAGELVRPGPDLRQDRRDQFFETLGFAEDVRAADERIPEKGLERLEQSTRRLQVGEDVRSDDRLLWIGRGHVDIEQFEAAADRAARGVVTKVRI